MKALPLTRLASFRSHVVSQPFPSCCILSEEQQAAQHYRAEMVHDVHQPGSWAAGPGVPGLAQPLPAGLYTPPIKTVPADITGSADRCSPQPSVTLSFLRLLFSSFLLLSFPSSPSCHLPGLTAYHGSSPVMLLPLPIYSMTSLCPVSLPTPSLMLPPALCVPLPLFPPIICLIFFIFSALVS